MHPSRLLSNRKALHKNSKWDNAKRHIAHKHTHTHPSIHPFIHPNHNKLLRKLGYHSYYDSYYDYAIWYDYIMWFVYISYFFSSLFGCIWIFVATNRKLVEYGRILRYLGPNCYFFDISNFDSLSKWASGKMCNAKSIEFRFVGFIFFFSLFWSLLKMTDIDCKYIRF